METSAEEDQRLHRLNVDRLLDLCERVGAEAAAEGLTDDILEVLLTTDD